MLASESYNLRKRPEIAVKSTPKLVKVEKKGKALDSRHPSYLGFWKRSIVGVDEDMASDDLDEPHVKRKHAILEAHPDVTKLYGIEPSTNYISVVATLIQLGLAYYFGRVNTENFWLMFATAYVVGGSFTQLFGMVIHEAAHGLMFESQFWNRIGGFAANIGIVAPIASSFRRYHLEHHAFQGVFGKDPDLPLSFEVQFIKGNPIMKTMFLFFYPLMYVVRGAAMQKTPTTWELANVGFTIATNIMHWYISGPRGFLYLFLSLWLGYGIHPMASHFIQEHFTFDDGQETYSYYGLLNVWMLNVGYHNEHHDFTKVAWSRLPEIKSMAPEFYDCLKAHSSWVQVQWNFVFDPTVGPQSRVGRSYEDHKKGRKMIMEAKKSVAEDEDDVEILQGCPFTSSTCDSQ